MGALLVLAGCTGGPPPPVVTVTRCPPLVTYPLGFQQQAADELPRAGPNVQTMVGDYGQLRAACRTIQNDNTIGRPKPAARPVA